MEPNFGNLMPQRTLLGQRFAKRHAGVRTLAHRRQRPFCQPDQTHAVMNAPRAQTPLRNFESTAFTQENIANWHPHIAKHQLGMTMRCIVVAKQPHRSHQLDARRIHRHQHHRLLQMARPSSVGFAHHDCNRAARIKRTRDPTLATVDHIVVAIAVDRTFDIGCVRRRHRWFGHGKTRSQLATQQ